MHCIATVSQNLPGLNSKIVFRQLWIAEFVSKLQYQQLLSEYVVFQRLNPEHQ